MAQEGVSSSKVPRFQTVESSAFFCCFLVKGRAFMAQEGVSSSKEPRFQTTESSASLCGFLAWVCEGPA